MLILLPDGLGPRELAESAFYREPESRLQVATRGCRQSLEMPSRIVVALTSLLLCLSLAAQAQAPAPAGDQPAPGVAGGALALPQFDLGAAQADLQLQLEEHRRRLSALTQETPAPGALLVSPSSQ